MIIAIICFSCFLEIIGCIGVCVYLFDDGFPCDTPLELFSYLVIEPIEELYSDFNIIGTILISMALFICCFVGIVLALTIDYCIVLPIWAFCKLFCFLFERKYEEQSKWKCKKPKEEQTENA